MKSVLKYKFEIIFLLLFVLIRLPYLGSEIFNTDVWKWKTRIYDFGEGVFTLNFDKTLQKYHPGVTLMWIGTVAVKAHNFYYEDIVNIDPVKNEIDFVFNLHRFQKFFIILVLGLTFSVVFSYLNKMFGVLYASIFTIFMNLEPFYYALSRVVHLEALLTAFMLCSFIIFYYYIFYDRRYKYLILSAILGGLAVLTKTSSIYIFLFVGLMLLIDLVARKTSFKKISIELSMWVLIFLLTIFSLWPALWTNTLETILTLYRGIFSIGVEEGHSQIFFGQLMDDPGALFYPLVLLFKSSIYLIPFSIITTYHLLKSKPDRNLRTFLIYTLLFSGFYFLMISLPTKKLDRYLIPSIMGLTLFYSGGIATFLKEMSLQFNKKIVLKLLLIPGILVIVFLQNDLFSYYNPTFGGLKTAITILEPKWIIGHHEIVNHFYKKIQNNEFLPYAEGENISKFSLAGSNEGRLTIAFPEKYYSQIWPFVRKRGMWPVINTLYPEARIAQFFVFPVWEDNSANMERYNLEFYEQITLFRVPIYNVYRNN